jgi:hypothetical protein
LQLAREWRSGLRGAFRTCGSVEYIKVAVMAQLTVINEIIMIYIYMYITGWWFGT